MISSRRSRAASVSWGPDCLAGPDQRSEVQLLDQCGRDTAATVAWQRSITASTASTSAAVFSSAQ